MNPTQLLSLANASLAIAEAIQIASQGEDVPPEVMARVRANLDDAEAMWEAAGEGEQA